MGGRGRRAIGHALFCILPLLFLSTAQAAVKGWDSAPWLADLAQMRAAMERDYPNRDWLTGERELSLDRLFAQAGDAIRTGQGDGDARRALDRLVERVRDGHVALRWPVADRDGNERSGGPDPRPTTVAAFCVARGYDAGQVTAGTAAAMPGYRAVDNDTPFATGMVEAGGAKVGVLRIGVFSPQGYPRLCEWAVAGERVALDRPCDEGCEDRVLTAAYAAMTRGLMAAVERLRDAGVGTLMVDLTRNGGGSEWAEAAARILSARPLRSAPLAVLRGQGWVERWQALASRLRAQARAASAADRALLTDGAERAEAIARGLKPCPAGDDCARLGSVGFASGLWPERPAGQLEGKPWAADLFSPAQFPYRDGVWQGPLILLVDGQTWSAAEQFAALLRDNGAAVVMGERTGGAGCGHLYGNEPIVLAHSGARLELPNCARFRRDGSNEVGGIVPDVPTGVRWNDGAGFAGRLTVARLADAVALAGASRQAGPIGSVPAPRRQIPPR